MMHVMSSITFSSRFHLLNAAFTKASAAPSAFDLFHPIGGPASTDHGALPFPLAGPAIKLRAIAKEGSA